MDRILFAITTYNQLEYTKLCIESLKKHTHKIFDILIVDDFSNDGTPDWSTKNNIQTISKRKPEGATSSWNLAYLYFKEHIEYKYFIIASNDILVPDGALTELVEVFEKWPFSLVVPMTSVVGAGHNGNTQGIENVWPGTPSELANEPNNYQNIQQQILEHKEIIKKQNNLYLLDPVRMKMFNGFFLMMNRYIINYEREDGNLFNPEKLMYQGEDEFNWASLIPNNDFPALCKTAFIFHYKGVSTKGFSTIRNDRKKWEELREKNKYGN